DHCVRHRPAHFCEGFKKMASAAEPRKGVKPAKVDKVEKLKSTKDPAADKPEKVAKARKSTAEQSRIEEALKETTRHARQQLAAQGLKLPTQGWQRATIRNRVDPG